MRARSILFLQHGTRIDRPGHKAELTEQLNFPVRDNNSVEILRSGTHVMERKYRLIAHARESIYIEQYIFRHDIVGEMFVDALIARAEAGVEVKVIVDRIGSLAAAHTLARRFRGTGVEFRVHNPLLSWTLLDINNRNHQKVLIVDGQAAIVAGLGIGEEYLYWHDLGIQVEGEILYDLMRMFEYDWNAAGAGYFGDLLPLPVLGRLRNRAGDRPVGGGEYSIEDFRGVGEVRCKLLTVIPESGNHVTFEYLVELINHATSKVYIANAYFVPNIFLRNALVDAAERGVDVRLLLPKESDLPMVRRASHVFYSRLLRNNIRIYEKDGIILHAKYLVIDGKWASIGSININDRAFFMNHESNILVIDRDIGRELEQIFFDDLDHAREITYEQWRRRGVRQRLEEIMVVPSMLFY